MRPLRQQPSCPDDHAESRRTNGSKVNQNHRSPPSQPPKEKDQQNETEEKDQGGRSRSRSPGSRDRKAAVSKGLTKEVSSPQVNHSAAEWLEHQGWQRINHGGNGDCGFRAICAAKEWNQNGHSMTNEAAQRHGAVLRSQALGLIRKHMDRYKPSLLKDEDTSPERPAPSEAEIQTKVDEYLREAAAATTWTDGILLQACSEKLGIPLNIRWKSQHDVWKRHTCAPAFDSQRVAKMAKGEKPLCWP